MGVDPHKGYFKDTVVTRFGFFLGIPPTFAWLITFVSADLARLSEVDPTIRAAFVTAMVWACWQVSVGTLLATLAMRGAMKYEQFYWLSDDFAVYVPFTGASFIWFRVSSLVSFVSFVAGMWLPRAAAS